MNPRVLIVDDDAASLNMSRKAMEALLPVENIYCASTAAETIAILGEKQIDLVFLDIDMPDTSGFSIAEYLGKNCPQVKFVFLTGYVDFAARSYDYEPLDFLTKPIDLMRLRKTLERYQLRSQPAVPVPACERIAIDTSDGFTLVYPAEIAYIGKEHRVLMLHALTATSLQCVIRWTSWRVSFPTSAFFAFISPISYLSITLLPYVPPASDVPMKRCWGRESACPSAGTSIRSSAPSSPAVGCSLFSLSQLNVSPFHPNERLFVQNGHWVLQTGRGSI